MNNTAVNKWTNVPRIMRKLYLKNERIRRNEEKHAEANEAKKHTAQTEAT